MTPSQFIQWLESPTRRPLLMGVLNVTPDSFSDGGLYAQPSNAIDHALDMLAQGAQLIDIGGESTRPGAPRIPAAEQIARIIPAIREIARQSNAVISVDSTLAPVAQAALDAGATLINDISAALDDPAMLPLAARRNSPIILMHMQGQPATMQTAPVYRNVVADVRSHLTQRAAAAQAAGLPKSRILIDPGIGFGKTTEHNLALLAHLQDLNTLGFPLVLGTSRKSFIGHLTGEAEPPQRLFGTAATIAWGMTNGAAIFRVHDVKPMSQVVKMISAILQASGE